MSNVYDRTEAMLPPSCKRILVSKGGKGGLGGEGWGHFVSASVVFIFASAIQEEAMFIPDEVVLPPFPWDEFQWCC